MSERLFQEEARILARAKACAESGDLTAERWSEEYRSLASHYQTLLEHFAKITKIGDMTQMKLIKAARRVRTQALELHKVNEEKDEMLQLVVHDLRSPINIILSHLDRIEEACETTEANSWTRLDKIRQTALTMLEMIENLLELARLESNQMRLSLQVEDLGDLLERICERNRELAERKEIEIRLLLPEEPLLAKVDHQRFCEVISNLLTNAIKFTFPKGWVELTLSCQEEQVLIRVKDSGIGVPPESLEKIFDKFTHFSRSGTCGEKSSGIGLSLTKSLVERQSGRIWAESDGKNGTTFSILFPRV